MKKFKHDEINLWINQCRLDLGTTDFKTGLSHFSELIKSVVNYIEQAKIDIKKLKGKK